MDFIEQAFRDLYPEREFNFDIQLKYSDHFKDFNANIRHFPMRRKLVIGMSKKWRSIDKEIKMGLVQELLQKLFGGSRQTIYIDYYHIFMRKVHVAIPKTRTHPMLEELFDKINQQYFFGNIEKPNLVLAGDSRSKLGTYEYGSDTITISLIMKDAPRELLEYVMYHEMLHKKFKFDSKNGRSIHHPPHFKREEKKFENYDGIEQRLGSYLASQRRLRRIPSSPRNFSFLRKILEF